MQYFLVKLKVKKLKKYIFYFKDPYPHLILIITSSKRCITMAKVTPNVAYFTIIDVSIATLSSNRNLSSLRSKNSRDSNDERKA